MKTTVNKSRVRTEFLDKNPHEGTKIDCLHYVINCWYSTEDRECFNGLLLQTGNTDLIPTCPLREFLVASPDVEFEIAYNDPAQRDGALDITYNGRTTTIR